MQLAITISEFGVGQTPAVFDFLSGTDLVGKECQDEAVAFRLLFLDDHATQLPSPTGESFRAGSPFTYLNPLETAAVPTVLVDPQSTEF